MTDDENSIRRLAHDDLTRRARGGIFIYLLAWLVIMLPNQVHHTHAVFFALNTAILVLLMLARLAHWFSLRGLPRLPLAARHHWLVYTVLAGAIHWGLLSAWVLAHPEYAVLDIYVIVTAAVLGIAGTTALAISRRIRLLFPAFMMGPMIVVLLLRAGTPDLIFASMAMLSLVYVTVTSKHASEDFWNAMRNRSLAEQRAREMEKLSVTDALTQLNNRAYFDTRFREEWKRGDRQRSQLSVLLLDLDHFKSINDRHGHVFGDYCLQRIAATLRSALQRETDIVARYGGEEFVVLLPDTEAEQASLVAERLRRAVAEMEISHAGETLRLTCSIGAATALPDFHGSRETLLKQADEALYRAKNDGRNRYRAFTAECPRVAAG